VHAIDITTDGVDAVPLLDCVTRHPATHYVVFQGEIYRRSAGFEPETYTGPDPHTSHMHVSILTTHRAETTRLTWLRSLKAP
jgi:hypothetical protein